MAPCWRPQTNSSQCLRSLWLGSAEAKYFIRASGRASMRDLASSIAMDMHSTLAWRIDPLGRSASARPERLVAIMYASAMLFG